MPSAIPDSAASEVFFWLSRRGAPEHPAIRHNNPGVNWSQLLQRDNQRSIQSPTSLATR